MACNYLQYIGSVRPNVGVQPLNFLLSGVDAKVRQVVGTNIVASAFDRGKTLLVVDNTQSSTIMYSGFGPYQVTNALSGKVSLCNDLLNVSSLQGISRLRALLADLGFDGAKSMKIISYLTFVRETERRLGKPIQLTVNTLEEYGSTMLVEWKLKALEASGVLDHDNYLYLVGRYAEVSGAAADFETFLCLISPFLGDMYPMSNMAVHLPVGEFATDKAMQQMLCKLLLSYIKQYPSSSAVLILDDGNGDRRFLVDLLKAKPLGTEVHMLSNDAFTLSEVDRSVLMNTFQVRIYTRHEDMSSCGKVAEHCGQIDVVKHSSTVTIDRRYRANSAWDILMGTNRTETSIANAPTKEYRFRKEVINSLCEGTGIIDYAGNKVLFSF